MAITLKKSINVALWVTGVVAAVGVGGLFINGTFMNTVLLNLLPKVVHTIVGWVTIVSAIAGAIGAMLK